MFDRLADYIHVERGAIPAEVCERLLAIIRTSEWQANTWYDSGSDVTYSEDTLEPDALFANDEMHRLLAPSIVGATKAYVEKFAWKDSPKTSRIVSAFSSVRFNRYGPGQVMRKHHDHIHAIFDGREKGIPVLSFVGNLNEDYEGGELAFFDGETKLALKTGDICMFPSCFLYPHQVLEVTKGQRFSFAAWAW
jgi:hypothetical protein